MQHEAIDSRTLTYTLPEDAATWSKTIARLHPDLYEFLASRDIPGTISVALKRYGELKEKQIWTHRPKIKAQYCHRPSLCRREGLHRRISGGLAG